VISDDEEPDRRTGKILSEAIGHSSPHGAEIVADHVEQFEEILPTVLLGRVGHWYWEAVRRGSEDSADAMSAARALGALFGQGDEMLDTDISTGFLEVLPHPHEDGRFVVDRLPQNLQDELRRMEAWRPRSS
jgi:hypothetical protein